MTNESRAGAIPRGVPGRFIRNLNYVYSCQKVLSDELGLLQEVGAEAAGAFEGLLVAPFGDFGFVAGEEMYRSIYDFGFHLLSGTSIEFSEENK